MIDELKHRDIQAKQDTKERAVEAKRQELERALKLAQEEAAKLRVETTHQMQIVQRQGPGLFEVLFGFY